MKKEKKSIGHVGNGERALETAAQAAISLGILSPFLCLAYLKIIISFFIAVREESIVYKYFFKKYSNIKIKFKINKR